MAPAIEACCLSFGAPYDEMLAQDLQARKNFAQPTLPAKKAAPPLDSCRAMGDLVSRAASRDAMTVEEEVTF